MGVDFIIIEGLKPPSEVFGGRRSKPVLMLDYALEQVDSFANLLYADWQRGQVDPADNG